jgi:hypothetical protein
VQVERALLLYSKQLIVKKTGQRSKVSRLVVIRTMNPGTEMESTVGTDFSKENWGKETSQYLTGIKDLPPGRLAHILDSARQLGRKSGKFEGIEGTATKQQPKSFRESLLSGDENSSEEEEEATEVSLCSVNCR